MEPNGLVYVVDDEASVGEALSTLLRANGKRVQLFTSGQDFLDFSLQDSCACLILDLNMPVLDGYSVASELRKLPPFATTPILALSAGPSETDVERLKDAGFSLFLKKPIVPARLRACIAQHLGVVTKV